MRQACRRTADSEKIMDKVKAANPGVIVFLANLLPGIPSGLCPYLAACCHGSQIQRFRSRSDTSLASRCCFHCIIGHVLIRGGYVLPAPLCSSSSVACVIMYANRDRLREISGQATEQALILIFWNHISDGNHFDRRPCLGRTLCLINSCAIPAMSSRNRYDEPRSRHSY